MGHGISAESGDFGDMGKVYATGRQFERYRGFL